MSKISVTNNDIAVVIVMDHNTYYQILATLEDASLYLDELDPGWLDIPGDIRDRLISMQVYLGMTKELWENKVHLYHTSGTLFPKDKLKGE